jgi:hypothetical protein
MTGLEMQLFVHERFSPSSNPKEREGAGSR